MPGLFGGGRKARHFKIEGPGEYAIAVVGESHYQENIIAVVGSEARVKYADATLILEDSNPYDNQAVRVDIGGQPVGHLNRDHAREYRTRLSVAGVPRGTGTCRAKIVGKKGTFGVWLDLPVMIGTLPRVE